MTSAARDAGRGTAACARPRPAASKAAHAAGAITALRAPAGRRAGLNAARTTCAPRTLPVGGSGRDGRASPRKTEQTFSQLVRDLAGLLRVARALQPPRTRAELRCAAPPLARWCATQPRSRRVQRRVCVCWREEGLTQQSRKERSSSTTDHAPRPASQLECSARGPYAGLGQRRARRRRQRERLLAGLARASLARSARSFCAGVSQAACGAETSFDGDTRWAAVFMVRSRAHRGSGAAAARLRPRAHALPSLTHTPADARAPATPATPRHAQAACACRAEAWRACARRCRSCRRALA